jgi:hypothetical protein
MEPKFGCRLELVLFSKNAVQCASEPGCKKVLVMASNRKSFKKLPAH